MKRKMCVFCGLGDPHDRVVRWRIWECLRAREIGGRLFEGVKAFYVKSRACVRIGRREGEKFEVRMGLRQGCVMSPWLFNLVIDEVVRGMNREGKGVKLRKKEGEWEVSILLFADDAVLVSDSVEGLSELVKEFERCCVDKGLKVNAKKSKVMVMRAKKRDSDSEEDERVRVMGGGEILEKTDVYRYLGVDIGKKWGMEEDIQHRMREVRRMLGGLSEIWKKGGLTRSIKVIMFESIVVPVVLYGCGAWTHYTGIEKKLEVLEMMGLRMICGVSRRERLTNEIIKERCDWKSVCVKCGW